MICIDVNRFSQKPMQSQEQITYRKIIAKSHNFANLKAFKKRKYDKVF
jgi:hypothetical protein